MQAEQRQAGPEARGSLANGNQFRVTPGVIEIRAPSGALIQQYERGDITLFARFGRSVRIFTRQGGSVELVGASDHDALQLETALRRPATTSLTGSAGASSSAWIWPRNWPSPRRFLLVYVLTIIVSIALGLGLVAIGLSIFID